MENKKVPDLPIVFNSFIPFPGYMAMMWALWCKPKILARKKYKSQEYDKVWVKVQTHEKIHYLQIIQDFKKPFSYYWMYLRLWLRYGYKQHPMELEAYENEDYECYPEYRFGVVIDWRQFLKKKKDGEQ